MSYDHLSVQNKAQSYDNSNFYGGTTTIGVEQIVAHLAFG